MSPQVALPEVALGARTIGEGGGTAGDGDGDGTSPGDGDGDGTAAGVGEGLGDGAADTREYTATHVLDSPSCRVTLLLPDTGGSAAPLLMS
jgi:hypothetical protein